MHSTNDGLVRGGTIEDYREEMSILRGTLTSLRVLKPLLYSKIIHTGRLFEHLAQEMSSVLFCPIDGSEFEIPQHYILASYYANIGFLSIEDSIFKNNYTNDNDIQIIRRHNIIGADLMSEKGFDCIANIIRRHHEKPNGTGYLKEQNIGDKLLGLLNIADEFVEAITPSKRPEPAMVLEEALALSFRGYDTGLLFNQNDMEKIRAIIKEYYRCFLRVQ